MIRKPIKGYTLAEIFIVNVLLVLVVASVLGAYVTTKAVWSDSIVEQNLQRDADIVVGRIIKGMREQTGTFGLRSAKSFSLPVVSPAGSEIDYFNMDGNVGPRRVFLRTSDNSIVYDSPTQSPNQKIIYTAPAGVDITLRFWQPSIYTDNETFGIYIALNTQSANRSLSGSIATYVNIRNLPK